jgi:hypothetical protein
MHQEETQDFAEAEALARRKFRFITVTACVVVALIVALYFYLTSRSTQGPTAARQGARSNVEDALETAQQTLTKETDVNTCRGALQQINSYLADNPGKRPAVLTAEQLGALQPRLGLDRSEVAEIEGGNYTLLDAHHLARCFLFRDAARSLEVRGLGTGPDGSPLRPTPLDQATAAFAWAVREVRLQDHAQEPLPAAYAARCGWGSALDRALVFLALLEQVGHASPGSSDLLGCLVFYPEKPGGQANRLWACGVVANGGTDVYLFDPRLGLPLPGRDGKGVATLAEVRKDPGLLAQFNADDKNRYDITPEQVRAAELRLVCPLSALAPRMRPLQDQFLPPLVQVRLARDAEQDLQRLEKAARAAGANGRREPAGGVPVQAWKEGVGLLRRFLPPDEGGVDAGGRLRGQLMLELTPWTYLPAQFRLNPQFSMDNLLGARVHELFARPFVVSALEPGKPRDLLLRGRFQQATPELMQEYRTWRNQVAAPAGGDLDKAVSQWGQKAIHAYAELQRARTPDAREAAMREAERLWKPEEAKPLYDLLTQAWAEPRGAEVVYLLGLCMHEQAERFQARLDIQARVAGAKPSDADVKKARDLWQDALSWWREYETRYPKLPGHAHARRLRGRAEAMRGDWQTAVATWDHLSDTMTPLEKLANLYLARQLKKEHASK